MSRTPRTPKIREPKAPRLPARIQRIVDACNGGGQRLTRSFREQRATMCADPIFRFEPSGRECPAISAKEAIAGGFLVPVGDGLFGDATSQTYVAAGVGRR